MEIYLIFEDGDCQEFQTEQEAIDYAQVNGIDIDEIDMEIIDGNS